VVGCVAIRQRPVDDVSCKEPPLARPPPAPQPLDLTGSVSQNEGQNTKKSVRHGKIFESMLTSIHIHSILRVMNGTTTDLRSTRTIAFVDIENLTGSATPAAWECDRVRTIVEALIDADHTPVVAACSHRAAKTASFMWPSARWKWRSGADGADLALLDELDPTVIASRFSHVVIGSGDGIFADIAGRLASHGVEVTVVSRRRGLANRLRLAAKHVCVFDDVALEEVGSDAA